MCIENYNIWKQTKKSLRKNIKILRKALRTAPPICSYTILYCWWKNNCTTSLWAPCQAPREIHRKIPLASSDALQGAKIHCAGA